MELEKSYLRFRNESQLPADYTPSPSDTLDMKVGFVLILILFPFSISYSQARGGQQGSSAQGSLTVTATVESSVWLVMKTDGKRDLVVANAPDPKQSFYHAEGHHQKRQSATAKPTSVTKEAVRNQDGSIQFSFPTGAKQFDLTKKTLMMDVSEGGRTERRPVVVTTIVPQ
jgi:hypothetical protein